MPPVEAPEEPPRALPKSKDNKKSKDKDSKRVPWNEEEKSAVCRQLKKFFGIEKLPGKCDIVEAQKKEPVLMQRPWSQIKYYIKNTKVSSRRKICN